MPVRRVRQAAGQPLRRGGPGPRPRLALVALLAAACAAATAAPAAHAQGGSDAADPGAALQGPSASDLVLIFAVSIAAVVGIALYISRDAIARKKTSYDRGAYESQRDRDYEKYHSEWGDETAEGHAGTGDLGGGGDGDLGGGDGAEFAPRGAGSGRSAGYYGVLGVGRDAAQDEIKRRYRELAKEAHPDRAGAGGGGGAGAGGDAGRRMALINEAYGVLSDPGRRRRYDLWLGRRGA